MLELLLRGQPSREIARALNIGLKTVEFPPCQHPRQVRRDEHAQLLARFAARGA